jgi:hypothetical protein
MIINFSVSITLERESGKFAPKDEIADELMTELDSAVGSFSFDNGESSYMVSDYSIDRIDG